MVRVKDAVLRARIDAKGAVTGAAQFKGATDVMSKGAAHAGSQVKLLALSFLGLAAATKSAKTIANYSQSMSILEAVAVTANVALKDQARVIGELDTKARKLGATTRFTASQAADGLLFLARAGFTANEQLEAINSTLDLASAGMLTLADSADLASNIVSQFGLSAAETERVVDSLINTSNRSNTSVAQLGEAMKFAGPVAGALGIALEDAASAAGVLGDRGIQASMAGTNLRTTMLKLAGPTAGAEKALAKLGLTAAEVNPATNDYIGIWEKFGDAFENLEDQSQKAALATKIFGIRNVSAALILSDSTARMRELTSAQLENTGAAKLQAKATEDNLAGSFRNLVSAAEALTLSIGDQGVGGGMRSLVDAGASLLRVLAGVEGSAAKASTATVLLATALQAAAIAAAVMVAVKLGAFLLATDAAIAGILIFEAAAMAAAAGTTAFGTALLFVRGALIAVNAFLGPVGWAVIAIGAAVTALAFWRKEASEAAEATRELREEMDALAESAQETSNRLVHALKIGDLQGASSGIQAEIKNINLALAELADNGGELDAGVLERVNAILGSNLGAAPDPNLAAAGIDIEPQKPLTGARLEEDLLILRDESIAQLKTLREEMLQSELAAQKLQDTQEGLANSTDDLSKKQAEARTAVDDMINSLTAQAAMIGLTSRQQENARSITEGLLAIAALENVSIEEKFELTRKLLAAIGELNLAKDEELRIAEEKIAKEVAEAEVAKATEARKKAELKLSKELAKAARDKSRADLRLVKDAERNLRVMDAELAARTKILSMTEEEQSVHEQVSRFRVEATAAQVEDINKVVEAYARELTELEKLEEIREMNLRIATSFEDLTLSVINGAMSAGEAIKSLLVLIQNELLQQFVLGAIGNALFSGLNASFGGVSSDPAQGKSLFNARGNAFSGGSVVPFARGGSPTGLIDETVIFPMRGGDVGIAREAGQDEFGAKVKRLPNGDMGIDMPSRTVNVSMNFPGVRNFSDFKMSEKQILNRMQQAVSEN